MKQSSSSTPAAAAAATENSSADGTSASGTGTAKIPVAYPPDSTQSFSIDDGAPPSQQQQQQQLQLQQVVQIAPLFGGAIRCSIPNSFRDISAVRQVPNNQECWIQPNSDRLLVVEILERQQDVVDDMAVQFFFEDLCQVNDVLPQQQIYYKRPPPPPQHTIQGLPSNAKQLFGTGFQRVVVGRNTQDPTAAKWILVELCLLRLPSEETDLLITLSSPCIIDDPTKNHQASPIFRHVIGTFCIHDWSLFG